MAPKAQPPPELFAPSSVHVALAIALIKSKPCDTTVKDHILELRSQLRVGSSASRIYEESQYFDHVAYWKEQSCRLQEECDQLRSENIKLERSNHSLTGRMGYTPDIAPTTPMNSSKRKAPSTSPARMVKRPKASQKVEQSAIETQEGIDKDFEFLDELGEDGRSLTENLFSTHKLCRATLPDAEALCHTLVRTAQALARVVRLIVQNHGRLSRQEWQGTGSATLNQKASNFAAATTVCARAFMSVLVGLSKMTESTQDQQLPNLVVYELANMFKTVLMEMESVARQTAQLASHEAVEPRKRKEKTSNNIVKESVPARALAHLLIGILGFLDKTDSLHQQMFDSFVYLLLERVGRRLYYCTFGRHRSCTIEGDIEPVPEPESPEEGFKSKVDALGMHLEVKALVLVLERAMGLAPNHMNLQASNTNRTQKKPARTLSLKNLPSASKARLSPVAKDRLQRTLVACMFGKDEVDDDFLDVLTKPMPGIRTGSLQNVARIDDKDVEDWYKKEVWRLVGWDILAKESGW